MTEIASASRGPLPFSSDDSSILLKSTLQTAAAVTSPTIGSAGTISASGITFAEGYGFKRAASGSCGITWSNLTGFEALDEAGQISFEIERAAICTAGSAYGAVADATNLGWIVTWTNDGGTTYGNLRTGSGDPSTNVLSFKNAGETNGSFQAHAQTKDDFVRVTITWNKGRVAFILDGAVIAMGTAPTRSVAWANQFTTIWLMHFNQGNGIRRRSRCFSWPYIPLYPRFRDFIPDNCLRNSHRRGPWQHGRDPYWRNHAGGLPDSGRLFFRFCVTDAYCVPNCAGHTSRKTAGPARR